MVVLSVWYQDRHYASCNSILHFVLAHTDRFFSNRGASVNYPEVYLLSRGGQFGLGAEHVTFTPIVFCRRAELWPLLLIVVRRLFHRRLGVPYTGHGAQSQPGRRPPLS